MVENFTTKPVDFMNIYEIATNKYVVDYVLDHSPKKEIVDEHTAVLLERAKEAGRSDLAHDFRKFLGISY